MTSLPAQRGGKVWSWKEVVSVFFPTRLKVNAGENKFWLAGLVSLKIFKIGFFHPHSDVFQVLCLSSELSVCSRAGWWKEIRSYFLR